MSHTSVKNVKLAQKESLLLREISSLFQQAAFDDTRLEGLTIHHVKLSPDKSLCKVYFYIEGGKKAFDEKLPFLKLYKPSMRKALSQKIASRYTPEIRFLFDDQFEKQRHVEALLDSLKKEDQS